MASVRFPELADFLNTEFENSALPAIMEAIRIPSKSPNFDPDVLTNGLQEKVLQILLDWVATQHIVGMNVHVNTIPNRTPLLFITIDASPNYPAPENTILLYGHADKQPECGAWAEGLDPYTPIIRIKDGERHLYGRAGADDLYALFSSLLAIRGLQQQQQPHPRCVILIEFSEESGSPDLPAHVEMLLPRIGTPFLVICLDSGTVSYNCLSVTTSLRGIAVGTVKVDVTTSGLHSGDASGVVPDSFMIARSLLDRIEDSASGKVKVPELWAQIPEERFQQAKGLAAELGEAQVIGRFPFLKGVKPIQNNADQPAFELHDYVLNRTWRPTVTVVGADGLPPVQNAGNVLRQSTTLKLSVRLPPTVDAATAAAALTRELSRDAPHGAQVTVDFGGHSASGWNAPATQPWMGEAIATASQVVFQKEAVGYGEGGSIPFIGYLGRMFPKAQFLITGVLGPENGCHGPNENLHINYAKKVTQVVSLVIARAGENYLKQ
jgi:acetylornithine deacetylase/succinyl-diaminopimelate desuccinylase-like protein